MGIKNRFQDVREWGEKRGIEDSNPDVQYQRCLQEIVEIHEAMINNDEDEFQDAIGDSIVTLIMLAGTKGYKAEDCLDKAFSVIALRKGLNKNGSFVRYAKLSDEEKEICDKKQGNPGEEYFSPDTDLKPKDFIGD
jgi:NTP pyrophosphatase (non-canonical NTP hydrolase)